MILYYTGPTQPNGTQIDPELSLGGYVSISPVANGKLENIMPSLSRIDIAHLDFEVRCIALTNTLGRQVTNIQIFTTTSPTALASIQLSVTAASIDPQGCNFFESIADGQSLPFSTSFVAAEGIANALIIPTLNDGMTIGIWMKRIINPANLPNGGVTPLSCAYFTTLYANQIAGIVTPAPVTADDTILTINYT